MMLPVLYLRGPWSSFRKPLEKVHGSTHFGSGLKNTARLQSLINFTCAEHALPLLKLVKNVAAF